MEGHENKEELDIEQALERLDSSEEALDYDEGVCAFLDKWSKDKDFRDRLDELNKDRSAAQGNGILYGLLALGGAGAAMFGIHDDLAQYMDDNTFWVAENMTSRMIGAGTLFLSANASWDNFKNSFKMGEKISRLRNQGA